MTNTLQLTTPRLGPRPLALHLGLATTTVASSLASLPLRHQEETSSLPQLPDSFDSALNAAATNGDAEMLQTLADQGSGLVQDMIDGIRLYHLHPYRRVSRDRPATRPRLASSWYAGARI